MYSTTKVRTAKANSGDRNKVSSAAAHMSRRPQIQTKLKVGKANDKYEAEADQMADKIVSNAPAIQRKCGACAQEDKLQKKPAIQKKEDEELQTKLFGGMQRKEMPDFIQKMQTDEEQVQAKQEGGGESTASSWVSQKVSESKGGGQPLSKSTRSFMETGFGRDFSNVRVHTDSTAVQMNKELGAQAFTHGNNVYFNEGKYNPESQSGKHLLAHELTHTVQQNDIQTKRIQRLMGFEFQTGRVVKQDDHRGTDITRMQTKANPIEPSTPSPEITSDLKMEVDSSSSGGVIEFVTGAHSTWDPIGQEIREAIDIIHFITDLPQVGGYYKPFSTSNYGNLKIDIGDFIAKPQMTEGIRIEEFNSLLSLIGGGYVARNENSLSELESTNGGMSEQLKGFVSLILHYLRDNRHSSSVTMPKASFPLMSRIHFKSIFDSLSPEDQNHFRSIIPLIPEKAGLSSPQDPVFGGGYWVKFGDDEITVDIDGTDYFISAFLQQVENGTNKVGAIEYRYTNEDDNVVVQIGDCESLDTNTAILCNNPTLIDKSESLEVVTVGNWLASIHSDRHVSSGYKVPPGGDEKTWSDADLLSPLPGYGGAPGAGYGQGEWFLPPGDDLIPIEVRNLNEQPFTNWEWLAYTLFELARNAGRGDLTE